MKIRTVTMVCWVITAIVLLGLAIWILTGNLFGIQTDFDLSKFFNIEALSGPYQEVGKYEVPAENIENLSVAWTAGEVKITPYDGNKIQITEYAQRELDEKEKLQYNVAGNTLDIQYKSSGIKSMMVRKKLDVLVPEKLAGAVSKLSLDCVSADVNLDSLNIGTLELEETSGTSALSDITANKLTVSSVSGSVLLSKIKSGEMNLGTVSGKLELADVTADDLDTHTTSGGQTLSGSFGSVAAGSISGTVRINSVLVPSGIKCDTTSGSIFVSIPKCDSLNVSYSTKSGNFFSEIPVIINGGSAQFKLNTISGSIKINVLK